MPVREICRTDAFVSPGVWTLCSQCCHKDSCEVARQVPLAEELAGPLESKRTAVTDCGDFLPTAEALRQGIRKGNEFRQILEQAAVADLCDGCPGYMRNACGHHAGLELIKLSAIRTGRGVMFTTHCCSSVSDTVPLRPKSGEKFHAVAEPAK